MPGLRLGWMVVPERFIRQVEILIQNLFISSNTPAQYGAIHAFDYRHLEMVRDNYRKRIEFLYSELKEIFRITLKPEGAFYVWADIKRYGMDSITFSERLLMEKGVAVTPGIDFGDNETSHYIRFACTRDMEELKEGIRRVKEFTENLL